MRSRTSGKRSGAAAAELAVVLPVLLLIVLGIVDFGRFAYLAIAVANANRAAAEYATTTPYTPDREALWRAYMTIYARVEMDEPDRPTPRYDLSRLNTEADVTVEESGLRRVRVTTTYDSFTTLVPWPGIPSSVPVRSSVVMRVIR